MTATTNPEPGCAADGKEPSQKELKRRLKAVGNLPDNQVCCDCGDKKPTWASLIVPPPDSPTGSRALGVFCCFHCSGAHRRLGVHICFVRSVTLDDWKEKEVLAMEIGGNKRVNLSFEAVYEHAKTAATLKPHARSNLDERDAFVKAKYSQRAFFKKHIYREHMDDALWELQDGTVERKREEQKQQDEQRKQDQQQHQQQQQRFRQKAKRRSSLPTISIAPAPSTEYDHLFSGEQVDLFADPKFSQFEASSSLTSNGTSEAKPQHAKINAGFDSVKDSRGLILDDIASPPEEPKWKQRKERFKRRASLGNSFSSIPAVDKYGYEDAQPDTHIAPSSSSSVAGAASRRRPQRRMSLDANLALSTTTSLHADSGSGRHLGRSRHMRSDSSHSSGVHSRRSGAQRNSRTSLHSTTHHHQSTFSSPDSRRSDASSEQRRSNGGGLRASTHQRRPFARRSSLSGRAALATSTSSVASHSSSHDDDRSFESPGSESNNHRGGPSSARSRRQASISLDDADDKSCRSSLRRQRLGKNDGDESKRHTRRALDRSSKSGHQRSRSKSGRGLRSHHRSSAQQQQQRRNEHTNDDNDYDDDDIEIDIDVVLRSPGPSGSKRRPSLNMDASIHSMHGSIGQHSDIMDASLDGLDATNEGTFASDDYDDIYDQNHDGNSACLRDGDAASKPRRLAKGDRARLHQQSTGTTALRGGSEHDAENAPVTARSSQHRSSSRQRLSRRQTRPSNGNGNSKSTRQSRSIDAQDSMDNPTRTRTRARSRSRLRMEPTRGRDRDVDEQSTKTDGSDKYCRVAMTGERIGSSGPARRHGDSKSRTRSPSRSRRSLRRSTKPSSSTSSVAKASSHGNDDIDDDNRSYLTSSSRHHEHRAKTSSRSMSSKSDKPDSASQRRHRSLSKNRLSREISPHSNQQFEDDSSSKHGVRNRSRSHSNKPVDDDHTDETSPSARSNRSMRSRRSKSRGDPMDRVDASKDDQSLSSKSSNVSRNGSSGELSQSRRGPRALQQYHNNRRSRSNHAFQGTSTHLRAAELSPTPMQRSGSSNGIATEGSTRRRTEHSSRRSNPNSRLHRASASGGDLESLSSRRSGYSASSQTQRSSGHNATFGTMNVKSRSGKTSKHDSKKSKRSSLEWLDKDKSRRSSSKSGGRQDDPTTASKQDQATVAETVCSGSSLESATAEQ